jgi:hypothetical protein
MSEWQPISTAPKSGNFQICLDSFPHLSWPAHADGGKIYSNAHGVLNELDEHMRILKASYWMPSPEPPENNKARDQECG